MKSKISKPRKNKGVSRHTKAKEKKDAFRHTKPHRTAGPHYIKPSDLGRRMIIPGRNMNLNKAIKKW